MRVRRTETDCKVEVLGMVDITEISAMTAAAGVLIGVVFAVLQLRDLVKTRQTDLVLRLYDKFSSKDFQDAWEIVRKRIGELENINKIDETIGFSEISIVCSFYEELGILLKRKLLDTSMIEDLFGGAIDMAWERVKTHVLEARQQYKAPTIYYYFEYLYDEMKKREQQLAEAH